MPLPESTQKISRMLARDEAYDKLRGWIIDGTLQPAEALHDRDIGATLGVSRTPVREALRRLEDEGLVETALNRWTRVAPLDLTRAIETYAIVEAMEVLALELAFPKLKGEDLEHLDHANLAMRNAAKHAEATAAVIADEAFHEVWVGRADNSELFALVRQLKTKLRRVELAHFDSLTRTDQSFREHAMIIKALKARSLPNARAALQHNWRASVTRIRALAKAQVDETK